MSYSLGQVAYTPQQANRMMGWTRKRLHNYWNERASVCQEFADEGECLARVARHVPVTLGGLGVAEVSSVRARLDRLRAQLGERDQSRYNNWAELSERLYALSLHRVPSEGVVPEGVVTEIDRLERDMWMSRRLFGGSDITPPIAIGVGATAVLGLGAFFWWRRRRRR